MSPHDPPSPWREFLQELDSFLDDRFDFHCIGGFALVIAYGLRRSTNDLDYVSLIPCNRIPDVQSIAGPGSRLAKKHKVNVQHVGVATVPENYQERLRELYPGYFKHIHLYVLDPYDLVLSKLSRNADRDREDAKHLIETQKLDPEILWERYQKELRAFLVGPPEQHDKTLEFWIEAYFPLTKD